jgi:PAS domain S-box-containing protein
VNESGDPGRSGSKKAPLKEPAGRKASSPKIPEKASKSIQQHIEECRDILFDVVDALIVVLDTQGVIVKFNPAVERLTGWKAQEVIGRHYLELFVPKDQWPSVQETFESLKNGVSPSRHENDWTARDGTRRWISWSNTVILDEKGAIEYIVATGTDLTERKRMQRGIEESEEKFRKVFDSASTMISISTLEEGRFVEVNEEFLRTLGHRREELIGKTSKETGIIIDWQDRERIKEYVLKGHIMKLMELPLRAKDGTIHHCLFSADIITLKGQRLLLVVFNDITSRKLAEEGLKKSEERFRKVFDTSPDAIAITRLRDGMLVAFNQGFERMTGYRKEEALGRTSLDVHLWKSPENRERVIKGLKSKGKVENYEAAFLVKDREIYGLMSASIIELDGEPHIISITRDITERKKAERELRDEKALSESVIENIPLMIFLKEATGLKFVKFNQAGEELLGYDRKDLLGKNDLDFFPPEQAENFMTKDREVLEGEAGFLDIPEEPIKTAKKGERTLHTRKVCIRGSDGRPLYLLGISEDITERKRSEEEVLNAKKLLQRIIDTLPTRIFWKDNDLKYLGCNLVFAKDAGKGSPEDMVGKDDFQMGWKEQAQRYRTDDRDVLKSGAPKIDFEEPQTTPDGQTIWLKTSKFPLIDQKMNAIGILGTYEDISRRKEAEEALKESERNYHELFENMHSGFAHHQIVLDEAGAPVDYVFLKVNKAFEQLTGLKGEDIIGKRMSEVLPAISKESVDLIKEYGEIALNGGRKSFDMQVDAIGSKQFTINVYSVKKGFFTTVFNDVTEQKRSQRLLQEQLDMLERFKNLKVDEILVEKAKEDSRRHERKARPQAAENQGTDPYREADEMKLSLQELESLKKAVKELERPEKGGGRG